MMYSPGVINPPTFEVKDATAERLGISGEICVSEASILVSAISGAACGILGGVPLGNGGGGGGGGEKNLLMHSQCSLPTMQAWSVYFRSPIVNRRAISLCGIGPSGWPPGLKT